MARASCRCGQLLKLPDEGAERVICPTCGARVRVRQKPAPADGFLRFFCPCGRRLKVPADRPPSHGKCPDCGKVVPVPRLNGPGAKPAGHPESDTAELQADDLANLERWTRSHAARSGISPDEPTPPVITRPAPAPAHEARAEAGIRVCPGCGRLVHLGASTCSACGTAVPRR